MKFTELSQHLHELRVRRTGRSIGYRMTADEIWTAALDCPRNGVTKIVVQECILPEPFDGFFCRLTSTAGEGDIVRVYVRSTLEKHWKEFVVAKELMHCWSPGDSYVGTPTVAYSLASAVSGRAGPHTKAVASDTNAIIAAAEVILPHFVLDRHIANGTEDIEVAHQHNLHLDVARMLLDLHRLPHRLSGRL